MSTYKYRITYSNGNYVDWDSMQKEFYDELRNNIIEEVALHIEKLKGFGKDTTDSLAVYIREMKK